MPSKSITKSPRSDRNGLLRFGAEVCSNLNESTSREWLETNGIGGFACSSLCGMNRRRYHALLTAATKPPVGRCVLLSKVEECLIIGSTRFDLGTNQYPGAIHPQGYRYLRAFRLDPFPVFTYSVEGIAIEKSIFMAYGTNTTVVQYRLVDAPLGELVRLELRPLVAFRDYHATTHANGAIRREYAEKPGLVSIDAYAGQPLLHLAHNAASVSPAGDWYRDFEYEIERERGLDFREDLFNPLVFTFSLERTASASIIASTEVHDASEVETLRETEIERRAAVGNSSPVADPFVAALARASEQYLCKRGEDWTVLAGYPWFTDWGRDTMISLTGLTLFTGRQDVARSVLMNFSRFVDQGMLPNRFPDQGEQPEFNTVDATLWYFEAIRRYSEATGDTSLVRELYPVLTDIMDWHIRGTRYGIKLLDNGLLNAGEPGVQLTWMDAKVGDWVVTPRSGKPVEVQALWYNALKIMEDFARALGKADDQKRFNNISTRLHWTFNRVFWNEKEQCLYDVVNGVPDGSVRPNQIFAISLHHPLITGERADKVLKVVERDLFTSYGLRTLSPRDPKYRGKYEGDMHARDGAYHQGTVWPWLMGPFITAYMKVNGRGKAVKLRVLSWLEPLELHLREAGMGQVAEVFDGDAPHRPGGCFAQAWSVAELLRTLCEDVHSIRTLAEPSARKLKLVKGQTAV